MIELNAASLFAIFLGVWFSACALTDLICRNVNHRCKVERQNTRLRDENDMLRKENEVLIKTVKRYRDIYERKL